MKKDIIQEHFQKIERNYYRVLINDNYEGYELKELIKGLKKLLEEAEGK